MFQLTILGAGSATPTLLRNPSAQILSTNSDNFLIDCGEGTQIQLLKQKVKINKIRHIFISHLHGDHYFGLIGLISSLNLSKRTEPLTIYGPKGLDQIIGIQLKYAATALNFKLTFRTLNTEIVETLFENENIIISTIPLIHRIPCCGFLFIQKPTQPNIIKEKLTSELTIEDIKKLKSGLDVFDFEGKIKYHSKDYTSGWHLGKKYAYCSDTAYFEKIIETIKGVDLLYHEATFLENLLERANSTYHSTAKQAATIAKKAEVKQLIIGHFSSRYPDLNQNLLEAKAVFENTQLANEGETYII